MSRQQVYIPLKNQTRSNCVCVLCPKNLISTFVAMKDPFVFTSILVQLNHFELMPKFW
jgi:hypothetical protein